MYPGWGILNISYSSIRIKYSYAIYIMLLNVRLKGLACYNHYKKIGAENLPLS
jgi:hypothetical protein